jgi:hypothetical protein
MQHKAYPIVGVQNYVHAQALSIVYCAPFSTRKIKQTYMSGSGTQHVSYMFIQLHFSLHLTQT